MWMIKDINSIMFEINNHGNQIERHAKKYREIKVHDLAPCKSVQCTMPSKQSDESPHQ